MSFSRMAFFKILTGVQEHRVGLTPSAERDLWFPGDIEVHKTSDGHVWSTRIASDRGDMMLIWVSSRHCPRDATHHPAVRTAAYL